MSANSDCSVFTEHSEFIILTAIGHAVLPPWRCLIEGSDVQKFVEQAGLIFEMRGIPRMAGRVLGWLLICQPPHQTMGEGTEALGASKSAISTALQQLQGYGLIEKLSLPGERADHYRMSPNFFTRTMEGGQAQINALLNLAQAGLAVTEDLPPEDRKRIQDMHDLYAFMAEAFPKMLAEWNAKRGGNKGTENG